MNTPIIRAADWNAEGARARRNRPLSGTGVRLKWTSEGVRIDLAEVGEFQHPWQLNSRWRVDGELPLGGEWVAAVRPGFFNGRDVTIGVKRVVRGEVETVHMPLTDDDPPELPLGSYRDPTSP